MSSTSSASAVNNFETNTKRAREVATTRTSRGRNARQTTGRYDGERSDPHRGEVTRRASSGLDHKLPSTQIRTAVAAVQDPNGNGVDRLLVTVNRNVDILEHERSHNLISEGAYRTGRILQEAFERASKGGGTNWAGGDKRDPQLVSDSMAERAIKAAQIITELMKRVEIAVGPIDTRLLRRVLQDRLTYPQCAELQGKSGDRGARYVATRFRDALEDLDTAWTAKGAQHATPQDKHATAASTAIARQRAAQAARMAAQDAEREKAASD